MLQAIGTGCGCADDRFLKTSLCSALLLTDAETARGAASNLHRNISSMKEKS